MKERPVETADRCAFVGGVATSAAVGLVVLGAARDRAVHVNDQ